jgi:hypothetical protein
MRVVRSVIAVAAIAALVSLGASHATAGGGRHHGGKSYGGKHYGGKRYGGYHHNGHDYYYYAVPLAFILGVLSAPRPTYYRPLAYRYYRPVYRPACHFVVKDAYDAYGRFAKFGGTMCYDAYGRAYIAPGSRHIIHYY